MEKIKKVTKIEEVDNLCALYIAEENVKRARQECDYLERVLELLKGAQMRREKIAEEMQDGDQPTQWLNGEQWTAAAVARRILKKLPDISYNCSVDIALNHYIENEISLQIKAYNPHCEEKCFEEVWLYKNEEPEKQAADISDWLERAGKLLSYKPINDHVAEPKRKEGENE